MQPAGSFEFGQFTSLEDVAKDVCKYRTEGRGGLLKGVANFFQGRPPVEAELKLLRARVLSLSDNSSESDIQNVRAAVTILRQSRENKTDDDLNSRITTIISQFDEFEDRMEEKPFSQRWQETFAAFEEALTTLSDQTAEMGCSPKVFVPSALLDVLKRRNAIATLASDGGPAEEDDYFQFALTPTEWQAEDYISEFKDNLEVDLIELRARLGALSHKECALQYGWALCQALERVSCSILDEHFETYLDAKIEELKELVGPPPPNTISFQDAQNQWLSAFPLTKQKMNQLAQKAQVFDEYTYDGPPPVWVKWAALFFSALQVGQVVQNSFALTRGYTAQQAITAHEVFPLVGTEKSATDSACQRTFLTILPASTATVEPSLYSRVTKTTVPSFPQKLAVTSDSLAAQKVISGVTLEVPSVEFNKWADELKKESNWKQVLQNELQQVDRADLVRFISQDLAVLRGKDREVLGVLFDACKSALEVKPIAPEPEVIARIAHALQVMDTHVINTSSSNMKVLGGGAVNTVYLVTYQDAGGPTRKGVFKPDPSELPFTTRVKEAHFGTAAASGIPVGEAGHLPDRSIASSVVDSLLFPDERISVQTEYAIVNGKRGIMMELVSGKSPKAHEVQKEVDIAQYPQAEAFCREALEKKQTLSKEELQILASYLHCRKVTQTRDQDGKLHLVATYAEFEHFDPNNSKTAEGLLKTQVFDWITGQVDRHPQNYFVDADGRVVNVDNDCSFGVRAVVEGVDVRRQPALKWVIPNNASLMLRMPAVVTESVKARVNALYENRQDLDIQLQPLLSQEEIQATKKRLEMLHQHINDPRACLTVATSADLLSEQALRLTNPDNSYLEREKRKYNSSLEGWSHLRQAV